MFRKRVWIPLLMSIAMTFLITIQAVTHIQEERSRADVNQDGIINILDLVIVAKYLGKQEEKFDREPIPTSVNIHVQSLGLPVPEAEILLLFPNKTWVHVISDKKGQAHIDLHTKNLPMTIYASAPEFSAYLRHDWVPSSGALSIEMQVLPDGGSAIFAGSTGYLPGLSGRLNPIRDSLNRTYLYADNIAINGGKQQPVDFAIGEALHLQDADGKQLIVRFMSILGRDALIEYRSFSQESP